MRIAKWLLQIRERRVVDMKDVELVRRLLSAWSKLEDPDDRKTIIDARDRIDALEQSLRHSQTNHACLRELTTGCCACRFDDEDNPTQECAMHADSRRRMAALESQLAAHHQGG